MKYFIVLVTMAVIALAEPPPSHSYLPPSPVSRNGGYPQGAPGSAFGGAPQIIAARTVANGNEHSHGNGFARNAPHDHVHARFNQAAQGYDDNSAALSRNGIDINAEPANYNFEYMVNDFNEGTDFGHHEERLEDRAQGQYHVVLPDGRKQTVSYEADERGFKPKISYEDSEELTRSNGYDANARNGFNPGHDSRTGY